MRDLRAPPIRVHHAIHVLEIIEKAEESAASGRTIDLTTTFDPMGVSPTPA